MHSPEGCRAGKARHEITESARGAGGTEKKQRKRWYAKDRLRRALKRVKQWRQKHRHDLVQEPYAALSRKLRGHYGYYGIIGNRPVLYRFHMELIRIWVKWLGRRSQRRLSWAEAIRLLNRLHLPEPPPWQAYVT